ncbi:MAG TPA: transposase [Planctomycetota bacterium]|nr:transposase [Planctomycetota bacterium]
MPIAVSACPSASPTGGYARREPEKSPLHLIVREHLETFLRVAREERGKDLPRYVEGELRRFIRCGILAHGFLLVACPTCGDKVVVGYSCKCRGACPSCSARRMCGTAAHLCDHVLPADVPVRQWVLTVPDEVRRVLALRPDALTACGRLFVEEIARWQKQTAKARGAPDGETGAVTFVQRFHGLIGCFVHFHVVVPDGVFRRDAAGAVTFHEGPAPSREDIASVAARVGKRMTRWLRRRGLVDDRPIEDRGSESLEPSPLEACMQMSLFGGAFLRLDEAGVPVPVDDQRFATRSKSPWAAEVRGYDVHAGVTVRAHDREGLERLLRYCARAPFSLERISLLPDGRVAYRLRKPRRNGATHLVLEPVAFLARIASIIPPPRFPLVRLAGVFAPCSPWRAAVVARAGAGSPSPSPAAKPERKKKKESGAASSVHTGDRAPPSAPRSSLGAGVVKPVGARIDWASLLRRVYLEDVLACPCGGRRRVLAAVEEPKTIAVLLEQLGLPTEPPPIARARSPDHAA